MTTTLFVIVIIAIIIFDIGIGLAMASVVYGDWRVIFVGVVMMVIGLCFAIGMCELTSQQAQRRGRAELQTTKIKLAVNQNDLDHTIQQLKQHHNDADTYRKIQADYYAQRQLQIRLQNRLNDEQYQFRSKVDHDD